MSCRALLAWALVSLFVVVTGADASLVDARGVPSDASGYTSVDASAVNCAAVFPGVSRGCCEALASNSTSDALASRRPLTRMAYASGTSLPYDAGHYHVCVHTPNAAYFLVGWHVGGGHIPVAELGLCLPSACRKADVEALVGANASTSTSTVDIARRVDDETRAAKGALRGFGDAQCASEDAPERCRAYLVVVAALDAAAAIAHEAARDPDETTPEARGWYRHGGTVTVEVTSSAEDRVGFSRNAASGWAALTLGVVVTAVAAVFVGTALDAPRDESETARDEMRTAREVIDVGGYENRDEDDAREPLLRGEGAGLRGEEVDVDDDADAREVDATVRGGAASTSGRIRRAVEERLRLMSLRRNLPKLLATPETSGPTDCLNGMRVLSMFWIIAGHTMMMPAPINGFDNPEDLTARFGARGKAWFMLVIGGEIAVDTFFFLGGFLVAYLGAKDVERRGGKLPALGMIAQRYARVTPAFAATLVFYSQIASRVGDGPFFVRFQRSVFRRCDRLWWTELLYLHNFVPFDSDEVCMGWSWYLGNDFIFFACSPTLLLLHHHRPRALWMTMLAVCLASFALTYWLVVSRGAGCYVFGDTWTKYSYYAYSKPYTRVPAHLVGMAFGFLNDRWISDESRPPRISAPALRSTLAAAAVGLLACVFGPLSDYMDAESWPPWLNGAFLTLCRPVWAAGLGVVATACGLGKAPRIDAFLAAPAWTPLARLTFGAYLMHPVVIKWFAGTATASYHFSPHYMVSCALLNATCAYALAAALWLVVERPTLNATSASRTRVRER